MRTLLRVFSAALLAALVSAPLGAQTAPARPDPGLYGSLHWRHIGPEGNRFSAVAGVPGDPTTYYVGAASGGVYKTTDGGVNWDPIFDDEPVQSIGALAVAQSDPNVVWAGTGEGFIRSHISIGQGVYKSTDAGATWKLMGLEQTGRIPRVVIDPTNPDVVLVCALGTAYGPQEERGVYRTDDGGATWTQVLFVDENTGCSDLAMDPRNPRILYAGTWQLVIHTWGRTSGGPGGGLWTSHDGGVTWTRLTGHGLPTKPVGKVAVAIAASNPQVVYALIETGDGVPWNGQPTDHGEVWRTDDGGHEWRMVSSNRNAMGRAAYYSRVAVSPDDPDETYYLTSSFSKSLDGGHTLETLPRSQAPGGDHHDIWIDPTNADRMIVGHDQGLSITINRGRTWFRQRLSNAQIYHVTVDNMIPYNVFGNKQDEPTYRGPSNGRTGRGIVRGMWHSVGGGESGWATPDPTDPNIIWSTASGSGMVGGIVVRYDESRRQFRTVEVWPDQSNGPAKGVRYRFVWDSPFEISPHDHNTVYVGSQFVHRTTNGGQSWEVISPDLTLDDTTRMGLSGGLTGDNIGVEYAGVVYAIAESPVQKGLIWVGTNDGLIQLTRDDGQTWTNLTANVPDLPPWGSVRSIAPSKWDAGTAYMAVDFHQMDNRDPFVYRTRDYGKTWQKIVTGVPRSMLSYAKVITEDPVRRGLLYLGTENAIYLSFDSGDHWQPLQNDLPHAPVSGIVVQEHFNDLVISTYGRGFYILDDLAPIQQLTPEVMASGSHLFPPRDAYRFRDVTAPSTTYDDPTTGEDPQYGAYLDYWLKAPAKADPSVEILDASGQVVRTLRGTNKAGVNRVVWDLEDEPGTEARLLTPPRYAEYMEVPPDGRVAARGISILMPPGTYTVRLTVDGAAQTQPLTVLKDPNSAGTEADIAQQIALLRKIRDDANRGAREVNRVEALRVQLRTLARFTQDAEVKAAAQALEKELADTEMNLVDLRLTGEGQDGVRWGAKLLSKVGYLARGLAGGDFRPTDQQVEVQGLLKGRLDEQIGALEGIMTDELGALNQMLRTKGLTVIASAAR
ncbi:MAG: sialidase [Gemmatimonadetes bacterium]|nr:sialidase [Gemmatimonadota bacterium]